MKRMRQNNYILLLHYIKNEHAILFLAQLLVSIQFLSEESQIIITIANGYYHSPSLTAIIDESSRPPLLPFRTSSPSLIVVIIYTIKYFQLNIFLYNFTFFFFMSKYLFFKFNLKTHNIDIEAKI